MKRSNERHEPLVRIFDDPVAGVGEAVDFGVGEELEEAIEEGGRKTPIAHAPDELERFVGKARQACLRSRLSVA